MSIEEILGREGAVARAMGPAYEERPQQLRMAEAVQKALTHPVWGPLIPYDPPDG